MSEVLISILCVIGGGLILLLCANGLIAQVEVNTLRIDAVRLGYAHYEKNGSWHWNKEDK